MDTWQPPREGFKYRFLASVVAGQVQVAAYTRAKVEHPFRMIKRQFGYVKTRFCGLAKNTAQLTTLFALSNLWMVRRQLLPAVGKGRP
ncbi:transposase [Pseudomonas sp. NBRC 111119]|uniref:transposase n=1 Tax=Pseudomonas sp. NBRC 111119 TaxID=1661034 RepID=UPI0007617319